MACTYPVSLLMLVQNQMGGTGILEPYKPALYFYAEDYCYRVRFENKYEISRFDKFSRDWSGVMVSGTLDDTVATLNLYAPYLMFDQISAFWTCTP